MAHPYHHSLSSVRKWGGAVEDYIRIHDWFDESKRIIADFRHRALRHHAEGIFMAETLFSSTIKLSTGRVIPVRWIGEQHVREDLGFIPSFADWVKAIRPEPWMGRALKLEGGRIALLRSVRSEFRFTTGQPSATRYAMIEPVEPKAEFRALPENTVLAAVQDPDPANPIAIEVARLIAGYMSNFQAHVQRLGHIPPDIFHMKGRWPIETVAMRLTTGIIRETLAQPHSPENA